MFLSVKIRGKFWPITNINLGLFRSGTYKHHRVYVCTWVNKQTIGSYINGIGRLCIQRPECVCAEFQSMCHLNKINNCKGIDGRTYCMSR